MHQAHYEVTFNNGERQVVDTFDAAHGLALGRAREQENESVVPVEIWEVGPRADDAGRIVEVVYAGGKVSRVAVPR
jgi:hypothetical protein